MTDLRGRISSLCLQVSLRGWHNTTTTNCIPAHSRAKHKLPAERQRGALVAFCEAMPRHQAEFYSFAAGLGPIRRRGKSGRNMINHFPACRPVGTPSCFMLAHTNPWMASGGGLVIPGSGIAHPSASTDLSPYKGVVRTALASGGNVITSEVSLVDDFGIYAS